MIIPPSWQSPDRKWTIGFAIEKKEPDDNPNCPWKWIYLKHKTDSEEDARSYAKSIIDTIILNYELHFFED